MCAAFGQDIDASYDHVCGIYCSYAMKVPASIDAHSLNTPDDMYEIHSSLCRFFYVLSTVR